MMAEILTEKGICDACGSEVREGSSFCFSCGKSVAVEQPPPPIRKPATSSLDLPNGNLKNGDLSELEPPPVPAPYFEPIVPAAGPPSARPSTTARRPPVRNRKAKTVEVEWVRQEPSAALFLIFSLLLAAIAAGLIVAAVYLR